MLSKAKRAIIIFLSLHCLIQTQDQQGSADCPPYQAEHSTPQEVNLQMLQPQSRSNASRPSHCMCHSQHKNTIGRSQLPVRFVHPEPGEVCLTFAHAGTSIVYTYDTFWDESSISWASRWDAYLKMPGGRVHWFSILNSLMVVLVMSSIVAMIMLRTIRRDLARYETILGDTGDQQRADD